MGICERGFLALLLACACTKSNPISCKDGYCQDERFPFCDVGGEIDGNPQTCIAVECTPNQFAACRGGDEAIVCNATGDDYDVSHCDHGCDPLNGGCVRQSCIANTISCGDHVLEQCDANGELHTQSCELGCVDAPMPHCGYISPKYLPDACDTPATADALDITTTQTLDTNTQSVCNGGVVIQSTTPDLCVLHYKRVSIESGGSVQFVGFPAVVIIADDGIDIAGHLDVSARGGTSGPGAAGGSLSNSQFLESGGGAGFATDGGAGGSYQQGAGSFPGLQAPALARNVFAGGYSAPSGLNGIPGGGGGAAMLIACHGSVHVTGSIEAGGGGGTGGSSTAPKSADGGGSGGYVVLQGASVAVSGAMGANGGGGGCGKPSTATQGANGNDARGGLGAACVAIDGFGGAGGAEGLLPHDGGPAMGAATPGGGGGSMGYFQIYTPASVVPVVTPSMASPAFSPNLTIPTR